MKEEFKAFVRKRPELSRYVNSGEMTWQKFYEQWSLYGEDENVWKNYGAKEEPVKETEDAFNLGTIMNMVKKLDMDSVQKGISSMQKAIELLQGLTGGGNNSQSASYSPRQLFKKFED